MRVLFVDQTGELGGGEFSLLDIVKGTSNSAEVALFGDGPFRGLLQDAGIPTHVLHLGKVGEIRREGTIASASNALPALWRFRQRFSPLVAGFELVYANSQKAFLMSALSKKKHQPLVWHLRDILDAEHFSATMRRLAVFTSRIAATAIIVNSQATKDALVRAGGDEGNIIVIHNGVDAAPFDQISEEDVAAEKARLGLQGRFTVGVFGRLSPWKGQHVLISAIARIPDVHAIIVGEALFGENDYAERLRIQTAEQGVQDRVHFLGFRRDIPRLMRVADVIAHTSIAPEPFGRVLVEGMLAERPVIASRAGGALEILTHEQTGLLIKAADPSELQAAIVRLQTNEAFAKALARRGREKAVHDFSVSSMVNRVDAVLARVRTR